jgi:hypothetical protein
MASFELCGAWFGLDADAFISAAADRDWFFDEGP